MIRVGCAGWSLSKAHAVIVNQTDGSLLERYASTFNAVEINSSFYRHHQPKTYLRWSQAVPAGFRFSVKAPRAITHEARLNLAKAQPVLLRFLDEVRELGSKLGPLLFQLPPGLAFDHEMSERFFAELRGHHDGFAVVEPRHPSWFTTRGTALLQRFHLGRVLADPAVTLAGRTPGGDTSSIVYLRLHGQPKIYFSAYETHTLKHFAHALQEAPTTAERWCIFDNTAAGHGVMNAWEMREFLSGRQLAHLHSG